MKMIILIISVFVSTKLCIGQIDGSNLTWKYHTESFYKVSDSTIKAELATFVFASVDSSLKSPTYLPAISISYCDDSSAIFNWRNTYVTIRAEKADQTLDKSLRPFLSPASGSLQVLRIKVVDHKYALMLPDSAFLGIYEPKFCTGDVKGKNRWKDFNAKVFASTDYRRIYIYMINGDGLNRYEVTWVIQDGQYHSRVLDPV